MNTGVILSHRAKCACYNSVGFMFGLVTFVFHEYTMTQRFKLRTKLKRKSYEAHVVEMIGARRQREEIKNMRKRNGDITSQGTTLCIRECYTYVLSISFDG